jgi:hypothetical protein
MFRLFRILTVFLVVAAVSGCSRTFPNFNSWPTIGELREVFEATFDCQWGTTSGGSLICVEEETDAGEDSLTIADSRAMISHRGEDRRQGESVEEYLKRVEDAQVYEIMAQLADLNSKFLKTFLVESFGLSSQQAETAISEYDAKFQSGPFEVWHPEHQTLSGPTGKSGGFILIQEFD